MTSTAACRYIKNLQLLGGLVTPTAAYHYIEIFNFWEAS